MASLIKNTASQNLTFLMLSTAAGTAITGATLATMKSDSFVTKDNGTQTGCAGTFTECGNGQYNYAPTQGETNATDIGFLFAYTGAISVNVDVHTDLAAITGDAFAIVNSGTYGNAAILAAIGSSTPENIAIADTTVTITDQ